MNSPEMHLAKAGKAQQQCVVCPAVFTPKRASWAKFCSVKCRNAFHRSLTPAALHKRIEQLEESNAAQCLQFDALEKVAHQPYDFTDLVTRLAALESISVSLAATDQALERIQKRLDRLEAIARGEVMP